MMSWLCKVYLACVALCVYASFTRVLFCALLLQLAVGQQKTNVSSLSTVRTLLVNMCTDDIL